MNTNREAKATPGPLTVGEPGYAANARLIAAAPDMLRALKDIMDCIAADELIPESVSYMQQARAAIAKAEG